MSASLVDVETRQATAADLDFVYSSWLNSFRASCPEMRSADYFKYQGKRIDRLLAGGAELVVAHPVGHPVVIDAWACSWPQESVLHYVYTREHMRRKGLAKTLVGSLATCTHMTDTRRPDSFAAWKHRANMRYVPHLLDEGAR